MLNLVEFDKAAVAETSIEYLYTPSLAGMTLPQTLRELNIGNYTGEELPPQLESLIIIDKVGPGVPMRLPSGLKKLGLEIETVPPLPPGLESLILYKANLAGVVFPEGLVELSLTKCRGMPKYPKRLEKLKICYSTECPPIPPTVREAEFWHCFDFPDIYSKATSLRKLEVYNCGDSHNNIPVSVTDLIVRGDNHVPLPRHIVSLTCRIPADFTTREELFSLMDLDEFDIEEFTRKGPHSVREIAACKQLKRLIFV